MITGEVLRPLAVALCLTTAAMAAAQDEVYFDTIDVEIINLDVIVTDAEGNPQTGLSRDDFDVYVDGGRVELTNFFAVEGRELTSVTGESSRMLPLLSTPPTQRLNLVVFIDDYNIWPRNRELLFENLRRYLREELDPRDRVMLVHFHAPGRVDIPQVFTSDPQQLLDALDRVEAEGGSHAVVSGERRMFLMRLQTVIPKDKIVAMTSREYDETVGSSLAHSRALREIVERGSKRTRRSLEVLHRFCEFLAGMPGRKAILYVSDGLPLRPADSLVQAFSKKYEIWFLKNQHYLDDDQSQELRRTLTSFNLRQFDVVREFNALIDQANSSGVAFYPLSAGGFESPYLAPEVRGNVSRMAIRLEDTDLESSLYRLAEGTGGIALTRSVEADDLIDRVVTDFTFFYSLGYTPPQSKAGEFHKVEVEVKVKREGMSVRHLKGYLEKPTLTRLWELTLGALHYDLEDNPLAVRITPGDEVPVEGDAGYLVPVTIEIPLDKLLLQPVEDFHSGQVSAFVVVRDEASGDVSPSERIEMSIKIPNEEILEALGRTAAYPLELGMSRGRQRISVGVHDHLARVDSTVSLVITVGEENAHD